MNDLSCALIPLVRSPECSLYELPAAAGSLVRRLVFTSAPTRSICNDPIVAGTVYTAALRKGCTQAISALQGSRVVELKEPSTVVFHILRGGLNFGLRESLSEALGFRYHNSAFISAQRARKDPDSDDWIITESSYQKVFLHGASQVVLGDVVATGTSLEYAFHRLLDAAAGSRAAVTDIVFFTIGSDRSHEIVEGAARKCASRFREFRGACVVYLEGIFPAAAKSTPLQIKIDGTDLIRAGAVMAPEFVESQYEQPTYPLERCTIYDAGSRAFDLPEYFHDVRGYWQQTLELARRGVYFESLLAERFFGLDARRFGARDLTAVCQNQLERIPL